MTGTVTTDDDFILELNSATDRANEASAGRLQKCVQVVCEKAGVLQGDRLKLLSLESILAIVSSRVSQAEKLVLINIALNWLRFPAHTAYAAAVLASVRLDELPTGELDTLKKTLTTALNCQHNCRNASKMVDIEIRIKLTAGAPEETENTETGLSESAAEKENIKELQGEPLSPSEIAGIRELLARFSSILTDDASIPSKIETKHTVDLPDLTRPLVINVFNGGVFNWNSGAQFGKVSSHGAGAINAQIDNREGGRFQLRQDVRDDLALRQEVQPPRLTVDPVACTVPAAGGSSTHQLANPGAEKLVFKVKSSNNTEYRIKPMFGFVEPGAATPLEITRTAGPAKEDKLVVQFGNAPEGATDAAEAFKAAAPLRDLTITISAN